MNTFYVYAFLREDDTPYYIGKGSGDRAWKRWRAGCNPPKNPERIKVLYKDLLEDEAFTLEKLGILLFGRKDRKTGILRNLTDGGEGTSGFAHSEEARRKISTASRGNQKRLGHVASKDTLAKMSLAHKGNQNCLGRKLSSDTKTQIAKSLVGNKNRSGKSHSPETRAKISAARQRFELLRQENT